VDFDNKSVTLKWAKPKDTGGRPISHYIIQKKDKFGGWFDALITDDLVSPVDGTHPGERVVHV